MKGYEWECPTYETMRKWAYDGLPGFSAELLLKGLCEQARCGEKRGGYERKPPKGE